MTPNMMTIKRTSALLRALALAGGEGTHRLDVVYFPADGTCAHRSCDLAGPVLDENSTDDDLIAVMELLYYTAIHDSSAVVIMQTPKANGMTVLKSWRVEDLVAHPVTGAQSFDAYCVGPDGELMGPQPATEYEDAPSLAGATIPSPRRPF